ncbi:hypothetical protein Athai_65730 [Actinocatenispora thailandica]|uniref:Uncharacterized protein n=1 Tax=Actinocatenispora thailandica TaxID=227318 RepID=A0A7R7DWA7_9ACTN|nr:hypothetical protein Athai_65730 [Actinocatenispora thailandica]
MTAAAACMLAAVLVNVVTVAISLLAIARISDWMAAQGVSQSTVDSATSIFKVIQVVSIIIYLLLAVTIVLLALGNLRGKRGTWIATFVISGLFVVCGFCGVLGNLTNTATTSNVDTSSMMPGWYVPVSTLLAVLLVLCHGAAIVLLAIKQSSQYFTKKAPAGPGPNHPSYPGGPVGGYPAAPDQGYAAPSPYGDQTSYGDPGTGYGSAYGTPPASGPGYGGPPASGPGYGGPPASGPGYGGPPQSGPGYGDGPGYGPPR